MQKIVGVIVLAAVLFGAIHVALVPFSNEMPGGRAPQYMDAAVPAYNIVLDSSTLRNSKRPKIIILGGSVSRDGIRPESLQHYYQTYDVHNAAIGGGPNFSELNRMAAHLILEVDPVVAHQSVVIIGVMFMLYASNELRYPNHSPSYVQQYESQMPLFWSAIVSDDWRREMKEFVRPYYAMAFWVKQALQRLQARWASVIGVELNTEESLPPPNTNVRQKEIKVKLAKYMGGGANVEVLKEQAAELQRLVSRLRAAGFRVVLYDMPVAQWLQNDFIPYQLYLRYNVPEIRMMTALDDAVFFADCSGNYFDADFSDGLHAIIRPERNVRWAANLVACMGPWLDTKATMN